MSARVRASFNRNIDSNTTSNGPSLQYNGGQNEDSIDANHLQNTDELPIESASTILCRYFAVGICRFGSLCRFSHDPMLLEIQAVDRTSQSDTDIPSVAIQNNNKNGGGAVENQHSQNCIVITDPASWINAPEFIPKHLNSTINGPSVINLAGIDNAYVDAESAESQNKSYAQILSAGECATQINVTNMPHSNVLTTEALCPYVRGTPVIGLNNELTMLCPYGDYCVYKHGYQCDMCGQFCLHPTDLEQRKRHQTECVRQHEKDMELSFAIARSKDKTCGVCFEIITEKIGEQRFGILPNCNHIFCLQCIRKWRQAKQFDNNIIRACPECRVTSDFVCPSFHWVESKEDKEKLISDYKGALGKQDCKYFKKGSGKCPFGNKCFYKHATPDGILVDVGVPHRQERRRQNANGETDVLQQLLLWNFLDARENIFLDDFVSIISDNSDSDLSESDMFD